MKKVFLAICMTVMMATMVAPVFADSLVFDSNSSDSYINPQRLSSGEGTEKAWLEELLGFQVLYLGKDEVTPIGDYVPKGWTYAVLKFGVGGPPRPDHWAVVDDGNGILNFNNLGLPTQGLSHITWFGSTAVPEPATMLLLGLGLVGLAGIRRKM